MIFNSSTRQTTSTSKSSTESPDWKIPTSTTLIDLRPDNRSFEIALKWRCQPLSTQTTAATSFHIYKASTHSYDTGKCTPVDWNYSTSSKHLAMRFFNLKEDMIRTGQLKSNHVRSGHQLSDILTKFCNKIVHTRLLKAATEFGKK